MHLGECTREIALLQLARRAVNDYIPLSICALFCIRT